MKLKVALCNRSILPLAMLVAISLGWFVHVSSAEPTVTVYKNPD